MARDNKKLVGYRLSQELINKITNRALELNVSNTALVSKILAKSLARVSSEYIINEINKYAKQIKEQNK